MEGYNWLVVQIQVVVMILSLSTRVLTATSAAAGVKTDVFMTEKIHLSPGLVFNRTFFNASFPKGHIGVKSFTAELVDEGGKAVPLSEVFTHHWVSFSYNRTPGEGINGFSYVRNAGVCQGNILGHPFGLASESRERPLYLPGPYVIEAGKIEEWWAFNVQLIDVRGVKDRLGCTTCRCDQYNVTVDPWGRPLKPDYKGGYLCCYNQTRCNLQDGFTAPNRTVFMKYTITYLDWTTSLIPVRIYALDVTDKPYVAANGTLLHKCLIEYDIAKSCNSSKNCVDTRTNKVKIPKGGDLIYSSAHQNIGGLSTVLYGKGGKELCKTYPIYGRGKEPGKEKGFMVGSKVCYPKPGSIKIRDGETLKLEVNYDSRQDRTAVVGIFYVLVADPPLPKKST